MFVWPLLTLYWVPAWPTSHVVLERIVVVDVGRSMSVRLARGGELDALVSAISCGSRGCLCSIPPPSSVPRLG